jgi:erythromycin esterase-like protein
MGIRETARTEIAQRLSDRTRALGDRFPEGETPLASSAGDLALQELPTAPEGSVDEIMAQYPVPDGDFVLSDQTLYYRDKRGNVYLLTLASVTAWRQRRTEYYDHLPRRLRRRILEITVRTSDGKQYLIETGKIFARQIRKAGKIRRQR